MVLVKKKRGDCLNAWIDVIIKFSEESGNGVSSAREKLKAKIQNAIPETGQDTGFIDEYIEIYDVPEVIFSETESDARLLELSSAIKSLSKEFQKLLHFIVLDYSPENVCLTMNYFDQAEYWRKREECIKAFQGSSKDPEPAQKERILKVYEKYSLLRDNFLEATDKISELNKKRTNRRKWLVALLSVVASAAIFFLLVFPRLIQKDHRELFRIAVEDYGLDIPVDSTGIIEDMILEEEMYSSESYWLMALQSLQMEDTEGCREQLKMLKAADRNFYNRHGRYINKRLKYR